ncbi:hypothetical protein NSU_0583 [Novosphingobium pentaromativorans US6-1]|uniref:Uncharacterized protein n=1 Tax=Novosphingobium pentaromativorans US6-1 TaxID=1088721 RepID=G6E8B2_9SPHN|nr:hypothetical protein NSU_0583 [Novosphingobium pentaromativorans US6-1]
MQPQPHSFVAQTEELPCRDHPLDQGKSDRCAGRSPGLRVTA